MVGREAKGRQVGGRRQAGRGEKAVSAQEKLGASDTPCLSPDA